MMERQDHNPLFTETQRFDQAWLRLMMLVLFGVCLYGFIDLIGIWRETPPGSAKFSPLEFAISLSGMTFGALASVAILVVRLRTDVFPDRLQVRLWLLSRTYPLERVRRQEAVSYRPIRDFGGWGIRVNWRTKTTAFTASGDRAVMIELDDGRKILIGSKRPEELNDALERAATT